jgi:arylsulfatase A-like enzyme
VGRLAVSGEVPRGRLGRVFLRGLLGWGRNGRHEPELPAGAPTLGTRLREAGYPVVYKGKWHLTAPLAGGHDWGRADAERIERDFGFGGWEPPDAGENVEPSHFGGGNAGRSAERRGRWRSGWAPVPLRSASKAGPPFITARTWAL